ncbi:hypothetical protein O9992_24320 [Vibrio lentus]|nr:hypothetical protein [Vibrio lentus]
MEQKEHAIQCLKNIKIDIGKCLIFHDDIVKIDIMAKHDDLTVNAKCIRCWNSRLRERHNQICTGTLGDGDLASQWEHW